MPKGKKQKHSSHHEKYDRAEQKHHFFGKIKWLCTAAGKPDAYRLLPHDRLEGLYRIRYLPFRIMAAPGENIQEIVLKKMRNLLDYALKKQTVPLQDNGPDVTLVEYHSIVEMFRLYLTEIEDDAFRTAAELKSLLSSFVQFEEGEKSGRNLILLCLNLTGWMVSEMDSRLYWVEEKKSFRSFYPFGHQHILLVHSGVPEKRHFSIDGKTRPSARLCWPFVSKEGIQNVQVNHAALGIPEGRYDLPLDVYIQMHALKRLSERLDCIDPSSLQTNLFMSFEEPCCCQQEDGSFLIEYKLHGFKAGYLVADIHDDVLVIRTFLFITNTGTPEGKKLLEMSGMRRLDKEFLAIDKLSTFMASDIRSNKELENLFIEAGCGCLLEIHDNVKVADLDESTTSSVDTMMKYLGLGEKEDFLAPDPIDKLRAKFAADG